MAKNRLEEAGVSVVSLGHGASGVGEGPDVPRAGKGMDFADLAPIVPTGWRQLFRRNMRQREGTPCRYCMIARRCCAMSRDAG